MDRRYGPVLAIAVAFFAFQVWQHQSAAAGALDYHHDWGAALEEARETQKPILLNFGGPW